MRGLILVVVILAGACGKISQADPSSFPRTTPEAEGIDRAALDRLLREAAANHTSALVILHDGKLVGEWYWGGPARRIEAMSATKSIVGLAVGMALAEGKLRSLDQPAADFFPAWRREPYQGITVRHLLNHTSGLVARSDTSDIYPANDAVALALQAPLTTEPGARFFYNNKASNLVPALVEQASGEDFVDFVNKRLFVPLGITDVFWSGDQMGHAYGMSGLQIRPLDFARIGQVLLDGGFSRGRRIVSEDWLRESTATASQSLNPTYGLLWWLKFSQRAYSIPAGSTDTVRSRGETDARRLATLGGVEGKSFPGTIALVEAIRSSLGDDETWKLWQEVKDAGIDVKIDVTGPADGFAAEGDLGQYLLVFPSRHLVAVRMAEEINDVPWNEMYYPGFEDRVRALVR